MRLRDLPFGSYFMSAHQGDQRVFKKLDVPAIASGQFTPAKGYRVLCFAKGEIGWGDFDAEVIHIVPRFDKVLKDVDERDKRQREAADAAERAGGYRKAAEQVVKDAQKELNLLRLENARLKDERHSLRGLLRRKEDELAVQVRKVVGLELDARKLPEPEPGDGLEVGELNAPFGIAPVVVLVALVIACIATFTFVVALMFW